MSIDDESVRFLEEVRKGKPRKFLLMCKGVKILGLKVYKKGREEGFKKELRKEGSGQFYGGVITGKGEQIVFNLLAADCDKAPTKELSLKECLAEAGMKFKPCFEIVAELPVK